MKVGIMQPYLFPYIGYFQLINAVDKFIVYDDVNFIRQGWINRNNILVQGKTFMFTSPLNNQSSFLKINEVTVNHKLFEIWKPKFLKTLRESYSKAPFYKETFVLIDAVLNQNTLDMPVSDLATRSIFETCSFLGIKTTIAPTSSIYGNNNLKGAERVIDICHKEKAKQYINGIGGRELYDKDYFKKTNLDLSFIKPKGVLYKQFNNDFVPWLSIIDLLMFNSPEKINEMLNQYELV